MPVSSSHATRKTKNTYHHAHHPLRIAVLFPGQGSQSVGMLADMAETFEQIGQTFNEASEALGEDLWAICQDEQRLGQTEYTQPALLTASIAIWRVLQNTLDWQTLVTDRTELKDQTTPKDIALPICLAGHSLGEYSALCASNAMSLATAVKLVHTRGKLMQQAVADVPAKMLAVLGLEDAQVISVCEQVQSQYDTAVVSVANFNSAGQVVVAGNSEGVDAVHQQVTSMGKRAVALNVSVPSHCALMHPASEAFAKVLGKADLQLPQIPVLQNRHGKIEHTLPDLKTALTEQLHSPVLWTQTMQNLADKHIDILIECGAGTVLSNLAKRQTNPIACYPTDKPSRLDKAITSIKEALA